MWKATQRRALRRIFRKFRRSPASPLGALPFLRYFTYKEIKRATDGFSRVITGGSAPTYKANFHDGIVGLVKKVKYLDPARDEAGAATVFHREVLFLSHLHHRHIIRLLGFSDDHGRYLVFDYMENGNLREVIHDPLRTPLTWRARLQIVVDVAASLEYLYHFCDSHPKSLTVSPETILLDTGAISKLLPYCPPLIIEKVNRSPVDADSTGDQHVLFQFGALILELVTGQSFGSQGEDLINWIEGKGFSRSMEQMVDSDLGGEYDSGELKCLLSVARLCVSKASNGCFTISHALRFLQSRLEPCST